MKKYNLYRELYQLITIIIASYIVVSLYSDFNIFNWSERTCTSYIISVLVSFIIILIINVKLDLKAVENITADTFLRILEIMKNKSEFELATIIKTLKIIEDEKDKRSKT